ncbi:MAG: YpdA family putative bacillithiol disulfide reductase [Chitinophagaceae bacterium]|nr:MAG: YpdA family putative bacillithiol disulfide reductase [Chitinophagaceae bacterium]
MMTLDLLIVGAGPIGLCCGIEAKKKGLSYLIADKGCLVNSLYNYPKEMQFFSTSEKLEIGGVPFISNKPKPGRNEALEYYRRVADFYQLKLSLYNPVKNIRKEKNIFTVTTQKGEIKCRNIILALGFYDIPNKLDVPGENLEKVHHYFQEAHPFYRKKILVVGAANSAVDVALECYRKGAEVKMLIKNDTISDRVKYWVKPDIENRIEEGSIQAFFNSRLLAITPYSVIIKTPEHILEYKNDFVLAMTGYLPDFDFLKKTGIRIKDDVWNMPDFNPKTMETNQKGIYLAGVICGGKNTHTWFIENSREHAHFIIEDIKKERAKLN